MVSFVLNCFTRGPFEEIFQTKIKDKLKYFPLNLFKGCKNPSSNWLLVHLGVHHGGTMAESAPYSPLAEIGPLYS